jgi:hypothetical protein
VQQAVQKAQQRHNNQATTTHFGALPIVNEGVILLQIHSMALPTTTTTTILIPLEVIQTTENRLAALEFELKKFNKLK